MQKRKPLFGRLGQTELIGLVVIVIMLTLGFLFLAKFALQEQPEKKIFTRKGLAYSSMSAVMKTQLECPEAGSPNIDIKEIQADLLEDCAKIKQFEHSGSGPKGDISCGQYTNSCTLLNDTIIVLLNETLGKWHKDYVFHSKILQGNTPVDILKIDTGGCAYADNRDSSGLFPIFVKDVGLIESVLYVCD